MHATLEGCFDLNMDLVTALGKLTGTTGLAWKAFMGSLAEVVVLFCSWRMSGANFAKWYNQNELVCEAAR